MYYRAAAAAIVAFDITSVESFNGAKTWVRELQRKGEPDCVIALSGNKCDMDAERKVTRQEAEEYAQENNLLYMETSAKTGQNVREIFIAIANKLPRKAKAPTNVIAPPVPTNNNSKGGCC